MTPLKDPAADDPANGTGAENDEIHWRLGDR
jgi:hypothetical protein